MKEDHPTKPRSKRDSRRGTPGKPHGTPDAGRVGAKLQPWVEEQIEFTYRLLARRLRRGQIIEAFRREIERRRVSQGSAGRKEGEPAQAEWRAMRVGTVDDRIRAARDRMAKESSPELLHRARGSILALYRESQQALFSNDPEAAARVAEKEAKLLGLLSDRVEVEGDIRTTGDVSATVILEGIRRAAGGGKEPGSAGGGDRA